MIYFCYYSGVQEQTVVHQYYNLPDRFKGSTYNTQKMLADEIKESKDDSFVFIIPRSSLETSFHAWLEKYDLEKFIVYKSEGITNPIHSWQKHNLVLYVLASKEHFWREMYDSPDSLTEIVNEN